MSTPERERFAGSLVGQCLGDALGFPVEGRPPAWCEAYVADAIDGGRAEAYGRAGLAFGQYTDDSQLARELLQSFDAVGRFDPADYARRVAAIFVEKRIVGRGRATEQAAARLAAGVPWDQAGTPPPSAGNGSAMRAGPVGLLFHADPAGLVRAAHDQGRVTHADPRCSAGAVAVAGAVALALRPGALDVPAFVATVAAWARDLDATVADALAGLADLARVPPAEAAAVVTKLGTNPDYGDRWEGISPFVTTSVAWSLYAFLRTPDDYLATIRTAIAVGGDVDTTAAMAGAISGARVGLAALPERLARRLNDQGTWGYDDLVALAYRCHARVAG